MDALRKAEQEKLKAAEAREKEDLAGGEAVPEPASPENATVLMPAVGDETIAQSRPIIAAPPEAAPTAALELETDEEITARIPRRDVTAPTRMVDLETESVLRDAQTSFPAGEELPADSGETTGPTTAAPQALLEDEELSMEMTIPSSRAVSSALRDYFSSTGTFTKTSLELDEEERYTQPAQKFLDGTLPSMRAVKEGLKDLSDTTSRSHSTQRSDLGTTMPSKRTAASSVEDFFESTQTGLLSATGPTSPSLRNPAASKGEESFDRAGATDRPDLAMTGPSKRSLQTSMNDFFDSTMATGERPVFTQTGEGARLSAELETGLKDSTQVTAYTVFAASQDTRSRQIREWGLAAAGLLAIVLGSAVLYQHFTASKQTPAAPPIAAAVPPSPEAMAGAKNATAPNVPTAAAPAPPADTKGQGPDAASASPAGSAPGPGMAKAEVPGAATLRGASPAPAPPKTSPAVKPRDAGTTTTELAPEAAPTGAPPGTDWGSMSIERGFAEQPVANALQDAYQSFRAGNTSRAEDLYRSVLRMNPDQRDALLGLAAIATKRGEKETAVSHYRHLLEIDPKDSIANAALYSLQGSTGGAATEAQLKSLVEQDPNSAHLQFTLGNVYAREGRWGDAQNAYFRALTVDKTNPDYAYNLAVSLDRLGQDKTAILYYRRALELGRQQSRSFNDMEVTARIQTLSSQRAATN